LSQADIEKSRDAVLILLSRIDTLPQTEFTNDQLGKVVAILQSAAAGRKAAGEPTPEPQESLAALVERRRETADDTNVSSAVADGLKLLPKLASQLTDAQLEKLLQDLKIGRFWSVDVGKDMGVRMAKLIEPVAPELAQKIHALKSPEAVLAYVDILIALLQLLVAFDCPARQPCTSKSAGRH
jgi:hypothetical protein